MGTKAKTRDLSVEAMRIFAAFCVIAIHSQLPLFDTTDTLMTHRAFFGMVVGDAVAVFWMISGFFMFGEFKYSKMLKKAVTKNIIPTVVIVLVTFLLLDWIRGDASLTASLMKDSSEWQRVLDMFAYWSIVVPDGHPECTNIVWFLMVYAVIMLIWPMLNAFVLKYLKDNNRNQTIFLAGTFALFAWNELTGNHVLGISFNTVDILIPSTIFVLWGYIAYQHKSLFAAHKWTGLVAIVVFIIMAFVRTYLSVGVMSASGEPSAMPMWWYTPWGCISTSCIVIACFAFFPQSAKGTYAKVIGTIGGATMMIYLVHLLVQKFFWGQFDNAPYQFFYPDHFPIGTPWMTYLAYEAVTVVEIFVVSLAVALLIGYAKKFFKFAWKKLFHHGDDDRLVVDCAPSKDKKHPSKQWKHSANENDTQPKDNLHIKIPK